MWCSGFAAGKVIVVSLQYSTKKAGEVRLRQPTRSFLGAWATTKCAVVGLAIDGGDGVVHAPLIATSRGIICA